MINKIQYFTVLKPTNVCFIKIRSKHSSNTLVSLLWIFMKQTLIQFVLPDLLSDLHTTGPTTGPIIEPTGPTTQPTGPILGPTGPTWPPHLMSHFCFSGCIWVTIESVLWTRMLLMALIDWLNWLILRVFFILTKKFPTWNDTFSCTISW